MRHVSFYKLRIVASFLIGWAGVLSTPICAQSVAYAETVVSKEYQIKAAFLYNFAKFVEWSPAADENPGLFIIGILGNDPFGGDIDAILFNKTLGNRKIEVKRFNSVDKISSCQILFIDRSQLARLGDILQKLNGKSVLTVSESADFMTSGGMINFVMEGNKVRFEINRKVTDKAGLRMSSQLLKLAKSVIT